MLLLATTVGDVPMALLAHVLAVAVCLWLLMTLNEARRLAVPLLLAAGLLVAAGLVHLVMVYWVLQEDFFRVWTLVLLAWTACGIAAVRATVRQFRGKAAPSWWVCLPVLVIVAGGTEVLRSQTLDALVAQRKATTVSRMERIGQALEAYHEKYGSYPPAVVTDRSGRLLHSWTVYLLPFLGRQDLYDKYHFEVPFDDDLNKEVAETRVREFQNPAARFRTDRLGYPCVHYALVAGPGAFGGKNVVRKRADITDDPRQTVLLTEFVLRRCAWTQPAATVDPRPALAKAAKLGKADKDAVNRKQRRRVRQFNFGPQVPGGINSAFPDDDGAFVLRADGKAIFLSDQVSPDALRALCTIAGGEPVNLSD